MLKKITSYFKAVLPRKQVRRHTLVAVALVVIAGNTLFLLARRYVFGCGLDLLDECRVSAFYQGMVLGHSVIGILLALAAVYFVVAHIPANWATARRRIVLLATGAVVLISLGVLSYSGYYFLVNAKSADKIWLYYTHISVGGLIVIVYFLHRYSARPRTFKSSLAGGVVIALLVLAVLVPVEITVAPELPSARGSASLIDEALAYAPPSNVKTNHPFFPSPTQLASGAGKVDSENVFAIRPDDEETVRQEVEQKGFADTVLIGAEKCVRCHEDITSQWASSAHRFSSFNNPYYVATIEFLRKNTNEPSERIKDHIKEVGLPEDAAGNVKSRWCGGCHDPALMITGRMVDEVDRKTVEAQAGLTCMGCHGIVDIPNHTGNGNYVWNDRFEDSYIFGKSKKGLPVALHDLYLRANPERHRADMLKPFFRTSEVCSTCHKVSLDEPVNDYRWFRGQNEFDSWHSSGVSHNAARTFYLPEKSRECRDCHMPLVEAKLRDDAAKDGKVRSHHFAAANTALPALRGDKKMIELIEANMKNNMIRVVISGVREEGAKPLALLTDGGEPVELGGTAESIELHVVVRNLNVGHTFPGGTNDSNQAWIEVIVEEDEKTIISAGTVNDDHSVNKNTRVFNALLVDKKGNPIDKRNAHEARAPIYTAVIPPGTADLSRYRIPRLVLEKDGTPKVVKVRLLWRKFTKVYNDFAFETNPQGFAEFKSPPKLPITEVATAEVRIEPTENGLAFRPIGKDIPKDDAMLLDYAISLIRQGDTALATEVIGYLTAIEPDCVNCWRTKARIHIQAGEFENAREALTRAESLAPSDPQNAWFWATLLIREGDYDKAISALNRVLAAFPEDREAHKLLSRVHYLNSEFDTSIESVDKALLIDSEDATAHYYRFLALRALNDPDRKQELDAAEEAYRYHQRDDTAQQVTLDLRKNEAEANFASQAIKVFELQ